MKNKIPGMKRNFSTITVASLIKHLLPKGAVPPPGDRWAVCPEWAPDVFAVAATLAESTGCFIHSRQVGGNLKSHKVYLEDVREGARLWDKYFRQPKRVQGWWHIVWKAKNKLIEDVANDDEWVGAVLRLLATSDEVCAGIGWSTIDKGESKNYAQRACLSFLQIDASSDNPEFSSFLPYRPHSLCILVPPDVAIVLPKATTTAVGCSLRGTSHHLSLLPGQLTLLPTWHLTEHGHQGDQLRLLVVPFPFFVAASSFKRGQPDDTLPDANRKEQGFFRLTQDWLKEDKSDEFVDHLVRPLLEQARSDSGEGVHGVLFPECAFSREFSDAVAKKIAAEAKNGLRFMVAGVLDHDGQSIRNKALCYAFDEIDPAKSVDASLEGITLGAHSKHHPWCLDGSQIRRYGLSNLFHSGRSRWWEQIDVSRRELPFFAIRDDLCMTVLICEDLARSEPAMPVIRAVGPNLVIALLMDGPQLSTRWPGRYATVLADDPGASVLSITCAGMLDRSNANQKNPVRTIGLWRHPNGDTQELVLPPKATGLMLHLQSVSEEQYTLDGRDDGFRTSRLELQYSAPIVIKDVGDKKWMFPPVN